MFFISKTYNTIKLLIASIGGIGAITSIIYGIVIGTNGLIYIIGGSIWLVQTGFNLFDSSKVTYEIKQQINRLETEVDNFSNQNIILRSNLIELTKLKEQYIIENKKLLENFKLSENQLIKLNLLKHDYERENIKYTNLLNEYKKYLTEVEGQQVILINENKSLKESLENLKQIQEQYKFEIEKLKISLVQNNENIKNLEDIKNKYIDENIKLQNNNTENTKQLEYLKNQIDKLKELYMNSLELIDNLRKASDVFGSFDNNIQEIKDTAMSLDSTQSSFQNHIDVLKNLIDKLKISSFSKLDSNNDGFISKDEFDANINKL